MNRTSPRRIILHFGSTDPARLMQYAGLRSAEPASGRNTLIGENQLQTAVGRFCGADHTAALQSAELDRLQIGNNQNLLPD